MNRYRVPKRRVPVRVSLRSRPEEAAHLFLGERAEGHAGPERPSDVLNRSEAFFAVESETRGVEVISREALAFMVVALEFEGTDEAEAADETRMPLRIALDDGRRIEGVARYRLPESARRLQDYLNQQERFLSLERRGRVLLLNKACILRVAEDDDPKRGGA